VNQSPEANSEKTRAPGPETKRVVEESWKKSHTLEADHLLGQALLSGNHVSTGSGKTPTTTSYLTRTSLDPCLEKE